MRASAPAARENLQRRGGSRSVLGVKLLGVINGGDRSTPTMRGVGEMLAEADDGAANEP